MQKYLLMVLFPLAVTVGQAFAANSGSISEMATVDRFVLEGAVFVKDTSLSALRSLPSFQNEVISYTPNKHKSGSEVEFRTFTYDGLEIYGFVQPSGKLGLVKVEITKPSWEILHGLNVGVSFMQVVQLLGEPRVNDGNLQKYCGESECVQFRTENGKIVEIDFLHYVD